MNDSKNITIGLLCVSAAILTTVLILGGGDQAQGDGVSVSGGEYIMFSGQVTAGTDMLYVVDLTVKKMNAYHFNPMQNVIEMKDQVDLTKVFREPAAGK